MHIPSLPRSCELKAFAPTLHFYFAKAYMFVRENFDIALSHPNQIRSWYSEPVAELEQAGLNICTL